MTKSTLLKTRRKSKENLIGQKFNRLTVIAKAEPYITKEGYEKAHYTCLCDCGNTTRVAATSLKNGKTKSCSCLQKEFAYKLKFKHGLNRSPLDNIYVGMKSRCYYPSHVEFEVYGGRGITMCKEWLEDKTVFFNWALSNGWKKGLVFDRIDVDGNYTPKNCRFVDRGLSARNVRTIQSSNKSGYRGVSWNKKSNMWAANIQCDKKAFYLGFFDNIKNAALAYDAKAKELNAGHPLNFPDE